MLNGRVFKLNMLMRQGGVCRAVAQAAGQPPRAVWSYSFTRHLTITLLHYTLFLNNLCNN